MGTYRIKKTINNEYRWTFHASNGENILTSETFKTNSGCRESIASSKRNLADANFAKRTSVRNEPYFVQIASGNYEPLATSEMYSSSYARDNGIRVVQTEAPAAPIDDQS